MDVFSFWCYFLKRLMSQTITAITRMTRKIPTPTPAWKISPTSSHEAAVNKMASNRIRDKNGFMADGFGCFVNLVKIVWVSL